MLSVQVYNDLLKSQMRPWESQGMGKAVKADGRGITVFIPWHEQENDLPKVVLSNLIIIMIAYIQGYVL